MREQEQITQLNKMQRLASGLLVLMAIVFVLSKLSEANYPYLSFLTAFAEAAMVGALADWFAVTALFKAPLGLPIPHTAVIPKNKDRIGESFANFLEHNFMTQEIVSAELRAIDFSSAIAGWLANPANSRIVARQAVNGIPSLLRIIEEDEDVGRFARNRMQAVMKNMKFAPFLAEIISILIANRHHQLVFDHLLELAASALQQNKIYLRQKIHEGSPRWMPKALDDRYFEKLLAGLEDALDELAQEGSEWRFRFQLAVEELIDKLKHAPQYEEKVATVVTGILEHPMFANYIENIWRDIKLRLLLDIDSEDSQAVAKLTDALRAFSEALLQDAQVRSKLNLWICSFATEAIIARRNVIAELVSRVIRTWDGETISRKLELQVGKDLQYIRINGTLVGGLVGLMLHAVGRLF